MSFPPNYVVQPRGMDGSGSSSFGDSVKPKSITWTLNEPDEAEFSASKNNRDPGDIGVFTADGGSTNVEYQIIDTNNSDRLLFWGPCTQIKASGASGELIFSCASPDWYLYRRFLDGTVTQFLSNPEFEDDFTDWVDQGGSAPSGSFTIDTSTVFLGDKSAKLVGPGTIDADDYVTQSASVTSTPIGLLVRLSAWFFIPLGTTIQRANGGRALYLEFRSSDDSTFIADNWYVIDNATPQGKWIKASVEMQMPASVTYKVHARLYAPGIGTVYWDDAKMVQFDSIGYVDLTGDITTPADVGPLICHVVDQLQRSAIGKSDVNIDTDPTNTGRTVMKVWQFSEHVQFDQAINEWIGQDGPGGCDYKMVYDAGAGTRTFHNFAGKRGTDRSGSITLQYIAGDTSNNVVDYRYTQDGSACITRQTVLGEDAGPDREETEISDATDVAGLILQDVRQAPQDTQVRSLDGIAQRRLELFQFPPISLELDVKPDYAFASLIGTLEPGDLVATNIQDGFINASPTLRVHQMKLNCETNVLTVILTGDSL